MSFFAFDLSIPAFGAMMLSDDVMTNPPIPPKISSDSLMIISAICGFNLYFLEILLPFSDVLTFGMSITLP